MSEKQPRENSSVAVSEQEALELMREWSAHSSVRVVAEAMGIHRITLQRMLANGRVGRNVLASFPAYAARVAQVEREGRLVRRFGGPPVMPAAEGEPYLRKLELVVERCNLSALSRKLGTSAELKRAVERRRVPKGIAELLGLLEREVGTINESWVPPEPYLSRRALLPLASPWRDEVLSKVHRLNEVCATTLVAQEMGSDIRFRSIEASGEVPLSLVPHLERFEREYGAITSTWTPPPHLVRLPNYLHAEERDQARRALSLASLGVGSASSPTSTLDVLGATGPSSKPPKPNKSVKYTSKARKRILTAEVVFEGRRMSVFDYCELTGTKTATAASRMKRYGCPFPRTAAKGRVIFEYLYEGTWRSRTGLAQAMGLSVTSVDRFVREHKLPRRKVTEVEGARRGHS